MRFSQFLNSRNGTLSRLCFLDSVILKQCKKYCSLQENLDVIFRFAQSYKNNNNTNNVRSSRKISQNRSSCCHFIKAFISGQISKLQQTQTSNHISMINCKIVFRFFDHLQHRIAVFLNKNDSSICFHNLKPDQLRNNWPGKITIDQYSF